MFCLVIGLRIRLVSSSVLWCKYKIQKLVIIPTLIKPLKRRWNIVHCKQTEHLNVLSQINVWKKATLSLQTSCLELLFLETLQTFTSQVFSLVPMLGYCVESEFKCVFPALKYSSVLGWKGKQNKFWYSMNWSSHGSSYLMPYWRVCIINEVAGNLSVKGRRETGEILIMLPPSLFQGISWGWHFVLPENNISAIKRVQRMFHFCVLCMCLRGTC